VVAPPIKYQICLHRRRRHRYRSIFCLQPPVNFLFVALQLQQREVCLKQREVFLWQYATPTTRTRLNNWRYVVRLKFTSTVTARRKFHRPSVRACVVVLGVERSSQSTRTASVSSDVGTASSISVSCVCNRPAVISPHPAQTRSLHVKQVYHQAPTSNSSIYCFFQ
jgi:hypothetical protein